MFRSLLLLTLAAASLAAGTAVADVYKYKDEKGNIQYTDKPPLLPAERLNVQSQRTDVVAAQDRPQSSQPAANARPAAGNSRAEQNEANELSAKDKAERCIKARERYDRYMNSQKLYEQDDKGERRYLDSAELDAARASAKASMDALCQ
ncbi:MAG: DUF4124 domain-containing protein [Pseudomonadota bacterium]|nr:DUF4124 domain-containing protein [Pseudomonadota bacterium]